MGLLQTVDYESIVGCEAEWMAKCAQAYINRF